VVVQPRLVELLAFACARVDFESDFITVLVPATRFAADRVNCEIAFGARAHRRRINFHASYCPPMDSSDSGAWLKIQHYLPAQETTALMRHLNAVVMIGSDG
jgi:hypothetical protein